MTLGLRSSPRIRLSGKPYKPTKRLPCPVEDCDSLQRQHGYCNKHWMRIKKYGDPFSLHLQKAKPLLEPNVFTPIYSPDDWPQDGTYRVIMKSGRQPTLTLKNGSWGTWANCDHLIIGWLQNE